MKTWKKVVLWVLFLLLVVCGGIETFIMNGAEVKSVVTKDTQQVSTGVVAGVAPACPCVQKPILKRKAKKSTGKKKPPVYAKAKTAPAPQPVAVAQARPPVMVPTKPAVIADGMDHQLDQVDTNWAKRMAAKPKEERVTVVREVVVIERPAKFVHVLPSKWNTCQSQAGGPYYCDNGGYVQTSYATPYTPASTRFQPVSVPVRPYIVTAPVIRTAPVAPSNPPGMGTR